MAYLINSQSNERKELFKPLNTIGGDPNADISIATISNDEISAFISRLKNGFQIRTIRPDIDITVSGRKTSIAMLEHKDTIEIGGEKFTFMYNEVQELDEPQTKKNKSEIEAYNRFLDFSKKLSEETSVSSLLNKLLDEVITLTSAEKGFLVLLNNEKASIKAARNFDQKDISSEPIEKSWTIVNKVLTTLKPVLINDAKKDTEFNATRSVINFKLSSIICVPLAYRGKALGAIYIGNNTFANVFDENSLAIIQIFSSQASLLVKNAIEISSLENETKSLKEKLEFKRYGEMIGSCNNMQEVFSNIEKISPTNISVLIEGETGTGKELIAREIHFRSPRAKNSFVVINCGAIPENLLESELFGHVRGAFTGAVTSQIGKFQSAHRGTLFLDEIGEMPFHLQVKILRALQEGKITRVGSSNVEEIDIRIIAATNRNLEQMVKESKFREDLYYRLNVVQISVPALRDRGNDILVIANYLLQKYAKFYNKPATTFTEVAQNSLLNYAWPGNVRQLDNRIKRALIMADGNQITAEDLDISKSVQDKVLPLTEAAELFRQRYINQALERNANNRTKAAKELGIDPRTVFRHLQNERMNSI